MGGDLELALQLCDLVLGLDQVLAVEVAVRPDGLVQVLLLLEFGLQIDGFFLEFPNQIFLKFNFLNHLHEI